MVSRKNREFGDRAGLPGSSLANPICEWGGASNPLTRDGRRREQTRVYFSASLLSLAELSGGEFTDFCADAAETVESSRREISCEAELLKESGFGCRDLGGRGSAVEVAD